MLGGSNTGVLWDITGGWQRKLRCDKLHLNPWWFRRWRIHLQCRRPRFCPWVGKIPWRREWLPTPAFLPGDSHGQGSLVGYSPCSHQSWTGLKWPGTAQQMALTIRKRTGGLPWWLSGKQFACQCRKHGFNPWSGKIPHISGLLSLCSRAQEPQLLHSCATASEDSVPGSLCSGTRAGTETRSPRTATRESPHSNKDPAQPKINKIKVKKRR